MGLFRGEIRRIGGAIVKVAALSRTQYGELRASSDAVASAQAKRATMIGRKIPVGKRPPTAYVQGAHGWSRPDTPYPQSTGAVVVTLTDAAWSALDPTQRALFDDLLDDVDGNLAYPAGFAEGEVVAGSRPLQEPVSRKI